MCAPQINWTGVIMFLRIDSISAEVEIIRRSVFLHLPFLGEAHASWSGFLSELEGVGTTRPRRGTERLENGDRFFWFGRLWVSYTSARALRQYAERWRQEREAGLAEEEEATVKRGQKALFLQPRTCVENLCGSVEHRARKFLKLLNF